MARFRAAGYTDSQLVLFGYNSTTQSNVRTAELLGQRVEQVLANTGASKVDIVSHSMGSLNSRYCVKFTGCAGRVDDWISISGNNNGTNTARWCTYYVTCREMVPGSALLTKLNSGSALPAGVQGTVYWTRDDQIISPPTSSILPGLATVEVTGVTHLNIVKNDQVIAAVLASVA
ncbi:esterase/lipase family protein [Actinokineospora soli]|uniref:Esterase/lipase family protein n=1 Tax=Actinokineospora soli TaxID=1048753 RepID=A0ABW2TTU4_9PSEU